VLAVRRALAVGAHPDDVELSAGGLLAAWTAAGVHVELAVLTAGQLGAVDPAFGCREATSVRRAESRAAAAVLGAARVHFLGEPDGRLEASVAVRHRLARLVREVRPDVVVGHDPWRRWLLHPDHRAAGLLTVDAAVVAREPRLDLDGVPAHRAHTLLLWGTDAPDEVVDIAGVLDVKLAALAEHASQLPDPAETARRVRTWSAAVGAPYGLDAAEAFHTLDLRGR
jgi:LmbE family N-acetylglucosaminyl deacetylase